MADRPLRRPSVHNTRKVTGGDHNGSWTGSNAGSPAFSDPGEMNAPNTEQSYAYGRQKHPQPPQLSYEPAWSIPPMMPTSTAAREPTQTPQLASSSQPLPQYPSNQQPYYDSENISPNASAPRLYREDTFHSQKTVAPQFEDPAFDHWKSETLHEEYPKSEPQDSTMELGLGESAVLDCGNFTKSEVDLKRRRTRASLRARLNQNHESSNDSLNRYSKHQEHNSANVVSFISPPTSATAENFPHSASDTLDALKSSNEAYGNDELVWSGSEASSRSDAEGEDDAYLKGHRGHRRCDCVRQVLLMMPFALQCLVGALFGDALIFLILGLPDLAFSKTRFYGNEIPLVEWTSNINVGGMPLVIWSFYIIISYTLHWATRYILWLTPTVIQRVLIFVMGTYYQEKLEVWLGYFSALHSNLSIMAWAILSNVLWNILISQSLIFDWKWKEEWRSYMNASASTKMWWDYVGMVLLCLFLSCIVWTAKRFIVTMIVAKYQRSAFSMRIKRMRFASDVLRRLKRAIPTAGARKFRVYPAPPLCQYSSNPKSEHTVRPISQDAAGGVAIPMQVRNNNNIDKEPTGKQLQKKQSLKERGANRIRSMFKRKAQKFAVKLGHTLLNPEMVRAAHHIPNTPQAAGMLAKDIYFGLLSSTAAEALYVRDFATCFPQPIEAKRAFRLFDRDGNGDVSKKEIRNFLIELSKEKQNLEDAMLDVSNAVGSLEGLFTFMALFIIFFIVVQVFSLPVTLANLLTLVLPLSFMFGSTAKDLFEALIFLFVYQSFAVGDWIKVGDDTLLVKSVSIFVTVLQRGDGTIVHYPNSVLSKKTIDNIRQSGAMSDEVQIEVELETSYAKIAQFEDHMRRWLASRQRDFNSAGFECTIASVDLSLRIMKLAVGISHKVNWQDMGAAGARRNAFMRALRDALVEVDIRAPEPGPVIAKTKS